MEKVSFAYVWREEQEVLFRLAQQVPRNGVIVEIGTALGGTAKIFHNAASQNGVRIYSIDMLDCKRAKNNLAGTDVSFVQKASVECSEIWKNQIKKPINLLYIDGDHTLGGVFEDFNGWLSLVEEKGVIAFHDYDPAERGGLAHFGVKICLDTLLAKGFLENPRQEYKILYGVKNCAAAKRLDWKDCLATFFATAERIELVKRHIFAKSIPEGLEILRTRSEPFTNVEACYCIDYALSRDFECLDAATNSFYEFRKWVELLSVLEHAYGRSRFPSYADGKPCPMNASELSRIVAAEQARISILSLVLKTLVDWTP